MRNLSRSQKWLWWSAVVAASAFGADRLAKQIAHEVIHQTIEIIPGVLELTLLGNENFVFYWNVPQLVVVIVVVIVIVVIAVTWCLPHGGGVASGHTQ